MPLYKEIQKEWGILEKRYRKFNPLQTKQCKLVNKGFLIFGSLMVAIARRDFQLKENLLPLFHLEEAIHNAMGGEYAI